MHQWFYVQLNQKILNGLYNILYRKELEIALSFKYICTAWPQTLFYNLTLKLQACMKKCSRVIENRQVNRIEEFFKNAPPTYFYLTSQAALL